MVFYAILERKFRCNVFFGSDRKEVGRNAIETTA